MRSSSVQWRVQRRVDHDEAICAAGLTVAIVRNLVRLMSRDLPNCVAMNKFPTSKENLALDLIFGLMGESRINRTYDEYMAIASRLPPLKVLHGKINDRLCEMAAAGIRPYQICHFKGGDRYPLYEDFPTSVSLETVRSALTKIGMRQPRGRRNS